MSDVQIPNLPAATALTGTEQLEVVQAGVSARATMSQVASLIEAADANNFVLKTGDAMTGPLAINSGNSTVGLTINAPDDVYAPRNLLINSKAGAEIDLDSGDSGAVYGFLSNGLYQWDISMNGPGGSLVIDRYNYVTGAWIDQPFQIEQGSGRVIIANDMVVVGDTTLNTLSANGACTFTGNVSFTNTVSIINGSINGGSINGTPIGATTPSTGKFTTLSASGVVSGAGFTALLAPYALINSQVFTGTPSLPTGTTGVTQSPGDSSTKLATTAFVGAATTALGLGTMAAQNANAVAITGGAINNTAIGATTRSSGAFTTLAANGAATFTSSLTASPASANVVLSPTGTGTVTINPATLGHIDNTAVGATTPSTGAFTTLSATGTVSGAGFTTLLTPYALINSQVFTGTPSLPTGTIGVTQATADNSTAIATTAFVKAQGYQTIAALGTMATQNANAVAITGGTINGASVGATTASTGAFTTLSASGTATFTGALTASPANLSVTFSPTGTGTVTINPATLGNINNMTIGATTAAAGTFTNLTATGTVSGAGFTTLLTPYALVNSQVFTGTPSLPTGTIGVTQAAADNTTKLATTAYVKSQNYLIANQSISLTGDVTGSGTVSIASTVVQFQGRPFASTLPTTGQVIAWSGTTWAPAANTPTPGGTNGQIQYNNSGALGGISQNGSGTVLMTTGAVGANFGATVTVTGTAGGAFLALNKSGSGFDNIIYGQKAGVSRWQLNLGNATAESAGSGSDFSLSRCNDAGTILDATFAIARFTGNATFAGTITQSGNNHVINAPAATDAQLFLNKPASGRISSVTGQMGGAPRWSMYLGNATAESANAGSDFTINRFNDAGTLLDSPLSITRLNAQVNLSGNLVVAGGTVAIQPSAAGGAIAYLNKSGSTQTSAIYGQNVASTRWIQALGDATAESGSNAGSDYSLARFSDAAAFLDFPLVVNRKTGQATFSQPLNAPGIGYRNRIINGSFLIDQYRSGTVFADVPAAFVCDRWGFSSVPSASKLNSQTIADGSALSVTGFTNFLKLTTATAYAVVSGDQFCIYHPIEGVNFSDLGFGTAGARTVTLSFWVNTSVTGTHSGVLRNYAQNRTYPFTYSVATANVWAKYSITIPGDTTGTWVGQTTAGAAYITFCLGGTGTLMGTAGAWAAANYVGATGEVGIVQTLGATFSITGIQLEAGSVASPFENRSYADEMRLCQRYFQTTYPNGTAIGAAASDNSALAAYTGPTAMATSYLGVSWCFASRMRAVPTVTIYNPHNAATTGSAWAQNAAASLTAATITISDCFANLNLNSQSVAAGDFIKFHATASAEI